MATKKACYPFILDHKPGFFLNGILYRLFKHVLFNKDMTGELRRMNSEGTVLYVIKYKGLLDYLLYHYRFRMSRLPYPKIAFDINMSLVLPLSQLFRVFRFYAAHFFRHGCLPNPVENGFLEDAIKRGDTALLCLENPEGFSRIFFHAQKDPLQLILETQGQMERPVFIVPQLIIYKKTPEKEDPGLFDIFFGFKDKPGVLRKIVLFFRHNRKAFIDFGEPLNLKEYLKDQTPEMPLEKVTEEIRQILLERIDRQKRVILGPVMKSWQLTKETVLKDSRVVEAIQGSAGKSGSARAKKKEAAKYFDEIAADYNVAYVQFSYLVLTWLWKKMFHGIDVNPSELAKVREWAAKGPLIYIPSHKSHIDYLILNYILFDHQMFVPRIAAGKNLSFWPVGPFFRKAGAFFIRRSFQGARLYAAVFTRYVKALIEEGQPLEFFIEGGRTRSGKLILPKIGFLSILVEAFREGYCKDLVFVPVSIVYDRVIESQAYLKEVGGGEKAKETFSQVVATRHFLKKKYGKIYLRFGEPVSLKEFYAKESEVKTRTEKRLAFRLIRAINGATLVTPVGLAAAAILTRHRRGFYLPELTETVEIITRFLERHHMPLAESLSDPEKAMEETIALLTKNNVVSTLEDVDGSGTFYYVDEEKKMELEFSKNSIVHFFVRHSFLALSLLTGSENVKKDSEIVEDYSFLKKLFRYEFIYEGETTAPQEIDGATAYFREVFFIERDDADQGYVLSRSGFEELPHWAAFIMPFLESYWIATRCMIGDKERKVWQRNDELKSMSSMGQRFQKQGIIDHIEAVSQPNFKNALRFLKEEGFSISEKEKEDSPEKLEKLAALSQRLYDFIRYNR
ncbi:MAG TPA: hypothetical protein HPP58_01080 [Deltaproteobacteria bacterium]|nr:hypothetical protein [Deltaproteobacteria bacterium]HIJ41846.1 hypothetical protein [Deltaproteobacteria bacterium]